MSVVALPDAGSPACGGKAAALALLARADVPVPDGFVVPVREYWRHVGDSDLAGSACGNAEIDVPLDQPGRVPAQRPAGRLAPDLLAAIEAGLTRMFGVPDGGHVAVRSSATSEDTAGASAAGQHDTVLAVRGTQAVAAAVIHCWASLRSDRARAYRDAISPGEAPAMAVLVQRFIDADASGVLFTGAPPTRRRVIEATPGIGDGLVGGQCTPDSWTLDDTGVVARRLGAITQRRDRHGDGIARSVIESHTQQCVTDGQVATLDELGRRIADILRAPADVERALAGGRFHILQARPITAALPQARTAPDADRDPHTQAGEAQGPGAGAASPTATPLHGIPASPGRATGPARIIRGPGDFARVRPGDILVCRTTDPAWTPLFRVAAGVATEVGGLLSHAAIVARELRLPAVLAVPGVTTELRDGAVVTLDADAGTILR